MNIRLGAIVVTSSTGHEFLLDFLPATISTNTSHISLVNLFPVIILISTSQKKEVSNLAKIFIKKIKYSDKYDSFNFKPAIFHNICFKVYVSF